MHLGLRLGDVAKRTFLAGARGLISALKYAPNWKQLKEARESAVKLKT